MVSLAIASTVPPPRVLGLLAGYLLGGLLGVGLSAYAFQRRGDDATARAFGYLALVAPAICFGLAGRVLSTTLEGKLVWNVVAYAGWVAIGPLVVVFALRFVDAREWLSRPVLVALSVVPVTTLGLVATAPVTGLHYSAVGIRLVDGWPIARFLVGPWFWVHAVYEYGLVLLGIGILIRYATVATDPFRTQAVILVGALLFMTATNAAFLLFGIAPFPGGDLTPFGIVVGLVAIGVGVFRVEFIDVVPVARDRVFEALDDPVVVIDQNGYVVETNAAAESLVDSEAALPAAVEALPRTVVEARLLTGNSEPTELELTIDGDERWFLVRRQSVGDETFALIFTDVSARREREQRLEEFASVLSHDLRNPLAVAGGNVELARDIDDPKEADERLETAERAIDRTNRMIDDLLALAREGGEVTETTRFDLENLAERAWEIAATTEADLQINGTRTIDGDYDRVRRALENLFRNSVEHGGDAVTVTVGTTDDGFYVADDGPGIPPEHREQVFERGFTTGGSGAGLGLAIVADVADAHGWSVEATESETGGARFEFRTDQRSVSDHEQS